MINHRKLIQKIHILKDQLRLPETEYRHILQDSFQARSSTELNELQLHALLAILHAIPPNTSSATKLQLSYISSLKKKSPITDYKSWRRRIVRRDVPSDKDLTKQEAILMIDALKRYHRVR